MWGIWCVIVYSSFYWRTNGLLSKILTVEGRKRVSVHWWSLDNSGFQCSLERCIWIDWLDWRSVIKFVPKWSQQTTTIFVQNMFVYYHKIYEQKSKKDDYNKMKRLLFQDRLFNNLSKQHCKDQEMFAFTWESEGTKISHSGKVWGGILFNFNINNS